MRSDCRHRRNAPRIDDHGTMAMETEENNTMNGDSPKAPERKGFSDLAGDTIEHAPPSPPPISPPRGRPPLSPPLQHRRGVSAISDLSVDVLSGPRDNKSVADILEQVSSSRVLESSTPKVQHQMTVADISGASPMEAEAETILLKTLEERETRSKPEDIILPSIPNEITDAFEAVEADVEPVVAETFQEVADEVRNSRTSTKGKLAGLSNAMRLLHKNNGTHHLKTSDQPENHLEPIEQETPTSDVDTFMDHANVLFRRPSVKEEEPSDTNENASHSGSDRDLEEGGGNIRPSNGNSQKKNKLKSPTGKAKNIVTGARTGVTTELSTWHDFVEPHKHGAYAYAKWMILVLFLPLLCVATILFYVTGNPMVRTTGMSISWLCLFILRNLIVLAIAKVIEVVLIDYISLRRRLTVRVSSGFGRLTFRIS